MATTECHNDEAFMESTKIGPSQENHMITAHDPYQTVNHPHQLPLPLPLDAESEALCAGFKAGYKVAADTHNIRRSLENTMEVAAPPSAVFSALREFQGTS